MSQDNPNLTGPEGELERGLASLRPASPGFDRVAIATLAVTRVMQRRVWRWRGACGALAAALAIAVILGGRSRDRIVERLVLLPQPPAPQAPIQLAELPAPAPSTPAGNDYHRLCQAVIDKGLDALPRFNSPARSTDLGIDPADLGPNARIRLRTAVP